MKKLILSLFMTILSSAALATPSSSDKLTDFALSKLQGLFDATTKAIPTVTKYTLQVTQMGCVISVIQDFFCLLIPLILWVVTFKVKKAEDGRGDYFGTAICGILALIVTVIVFVGFLSDMWKVVCIVHPDIYLIHLAVQKVLGQ